MCQAKVVLDGNEFMDDVVFIELAEEGVYLSRFFEEPILVQAELRSMDLLKHTVVLETKPQKFSEYEKEIG